MDSITIYVMGNERIAEMLRLYLDRSLGKAKFRKVQSGTNPPANKPTILFVGQSHLAANAIAYC